MFEFFKRLVRSTKNREQDVVFLVDLPEIPNPPQNRSHAQHSRSAHASRQSSQSNLAATNAIRTVGNVPDSSTGSPNDSALETIALARHARKRSAPAHLPNQSLASSHRERLLAMRIEHLKLCPEARCKQLADIGVQTAGDLIFGDPKRIARSFRNPERAERAIRRYRAAIRLALAVDSMMPRDALLLVAIHRRSVASLSRESAAQLHRDLERFSMSSRGSKMIGRRGVPSLRRVKAWVSTCRELAAAATGPELANQAA
ncbi:MAG: DUF4332 domain-containing protein [Rhodopirellula sp. JB044]|uniref:DUF4332 domain-containing protein n=1 Tax=Rhodopirellula sp. JB044 TaxID=3342844 RepID=UPI00370BA82E